MTDTVKVVGCRIDKDGDVYLMLSNDTENKVLSAIVCRIVLDHFIKIPLTYLGDN